MGRTDGETTVATVPDTEDSFLPLHCLMQGWREGRFERLRGRPTWFVRRLYASVLPWFFRWSLGVGRWRQIEIRGRKDKVSPRLRPRPIVADGTVRRARTDTQRIHGGATADPREAFLVDLGIL